KTVDPLKRYLRKKTFIKIRDAVKIITDISYTFNNLCPFFQGTKVKLTLYFFSIRAKKKIPTIIAG
ncbi:MAG: hypothetical protein ABI203_07425, partial [Mucilaginibacter sp.]